MMIIINHSSSKINNNLQLAHIRHIVFDVNHWLASYYVNLRGLPGIRNYAFHGISAAYLTAPRDRLFVYLLAQTDSRVISLVLKINRWWSTTNKAIPILINIIGSSALVVIKQAAMIAVAITEHWSPQRWSTSKDCKSDEWVLRLSRTITGCSGSD